MNPEKQRVLIAMACGVHLFDGHIGAANHELPDYLNDLNAMHEAEAGMDSPDQFKFCEHLEVITKARWKVVEGGYTVEGKIRFRPIHATAAQRAEAFLKTINKWEAE
jgi:hypothetical protein